MNQTEIPAQCVSPHPLGFRSHGLSSGSLPYPHLPSFTPVWYSLTPALTALGCQRAILVTTVPQHQPVRDWAQRSGLLVNK